MYSPSLTKPPLLGYRLNNTLALHIIGPPNMHNAQSRPFQQFPRMLLRPLHCAECRHHVQVLVCHEGGGSLRRDDPLINQNLAVRWIHGRTDVLEDGPAERVIPIVQDVA